MSKTPYQNIDVSLLELNEGQLEGLPKNPRFIKTHRYDALKKSIEDAPELLEARTLLVYPLENGHYIVIGGNMRLRACKELGFKELPCYVFKQETPVEKLAEYVIKDNVAFGDVDWNLIANEWDTGDFASMCEHHVLPFMGKYYFAYIPHPKGKILGLSKIARVVDYCAARMQIQERLVHDIVNMIESALTEGLDDEYAPLGIACVMKAHHTCKEIRGARKKGIMSSSCLTGLFKTDAAVRSEFMNLINNSE